MGPFPDLIPDTGALSDGTVECKVPPGADEARVEGNSR